MSKEEYLKIVEIFKNCDSAIEVAVKTVFEMLKQDCISFADLDNKIDVLYKNIRVWYSTAPDYCKYVEELKKMSDSEKGKMKISNCP